MMGARAVAWIAFPLASVALSAAAAAQSALVIIPSGELSALGPAPFRHDAIGSPATIHGEPAAPQNTVPGGTVARLVTVDEDAIAPSEEVRQLTDWVISSGDNNGLPFMVIDKVAAEVFVHDADGGLVGAGPALLGLARGDDSAPGVGKRKLSAIGNDDRTTPAGRFVAKFGPATGYKTVLWVDYPTSVSMHPVITTDKKERRLKRLKSPTPDDNRITFGCINVFPAFYQKVVKQRFKHNGGIVYILPETKPVGEVFLAFRPFSLPTGR